MARRFRLLPAALLLGAAARAVAAPGVDLSSAAAQVLPSTVRVEVPARGLPAPALVELAAAWGLPLPRVTAAPGGAAGHGAGVVIDGGGLVLTNHHVVQGAQAVRVHLADGRTLPGAVRAIDPASDLALVALDGPARLRPVRWGAAPAVGAPVGAIGHPEDLAFTVSAGILSATGRPLPRAVGGGPYLQTDLLLSPGYSGGPLFDAEGRVIGINTAVLHVGGSGAPVAAAFAIPAAQAQAVAAHLRAGGRGPQPALGLRVERAPAAAQVDGRGLRVTAITPGGPAHAAGVRVGEVLLAAEGQGLERPADLRAVVRGRAPGARVTLSRATPDGARPVELRVGEGVAGAAGAAGAAGVAWRGAVLVAQDGGWSVTGVRVGSPAAAVGLRVGDVLLSVDGAELRAATGLAGARPRAVLAVQRGSARVHTICPGEAPGG